MTYTATLADATLIEDSLAAAGRLAVAGSDTALAEVRSIEEQLKVTVFEGIIDQDYFRSCVLRRARDLIGHNDWTVLRMRLAGPRVPPSRPGCDHCGNAVTHARWCRHNRSA